MSKIVKLFALMLTLIIFTACGGSSGGGDNSAPEPPTTTTHNGTTYGFVTSPYTGKVWLDRNLGAAQVCIAFNDVQCFGDYYQFGRNADGHEDQGSASIILPATQIDPVQQAVDGKYITGFFDWVDNGVDDDRSLRVGKWSATDGSSVCPVGFRIPTENELKAEIFDAGSAEIGNRDDAFASFLKLPSAGNRSHINGALFDPGVHGNVTMITQYNQYAYGLTFFDNGVAKSMHPLADGTSLRCIKN